MGLHLGFRNCCNNITFLTCRTHLPCFWESSFCHTCVRSFLQIAHLGSSVVHKSQFIHALRHQVPFPAGSGLSTSAMWPPGWACLHPNTSFLGLWISHATSHLKGTHLPLKSSSPCSFPDVWYEDSPQFFGFLKITFPGTYICLENCLSLRPSADRVGGRVCMWSSVWVAYPDLHGGGWDQARKLFKSWDAQDQRNQSIIWKKLHKNVYKLTFALQNLYQK